MQSTYEGAARRLARVLELSNQATQEVAALRQGKRARHDEAQRIADELSKALSPRAERGESPDLES